MHAHLTWCSRDVWLLGIGGKRLLSEMRDGVFFVEVSRHLVLATGPIMSGNVIAHQCFLGGMVGLTELESVTSCVSSRRSNQLSYKPVFSPSYQTRGPFGED